MTETELRNKLVSVMQSWVGRNEADGSHKAIIDIYNSVKPLPRGYAVQYSDHWCATTVSAAAYSCALGGIVYPECGCGQMVQLYQEHGRWVENDAHVPLPGDIIFYFWNDPGTGDCTGWPNHVGVVEKVTGKTITVIEGNKHEAVGRRTLEVNSRYIRGYGVPDYASLTTPDWEAERAEAMKWCKDNGIMDGTRPLDNITRGEVAVISRRILRKLGVE